jgi:hypothetical protein
VHDAETAGWCRDTLLLAKPLGSLPFNGDSTFPLGITRDEVAMTESKLISWYREL